MNFSPDVTNMKPGMVLGGKYRIVREIGRGGMGCVFEGLNESLKKPVAIKVLNPTLLIDKTSRDRFQIETEAGAKLSHPNLISVIDSGFTEIGEPYLVMEYINGQGLDALLASRERPNLQTLIPILIQVCKALKYLHASNIVHRDLKSSNILVHQIAGETYAKLLDLGIVKILSDSTTRNNLTATGMVFGTVTYMSPEQAQGNPIDGRSDIYSLGCILYECVAGHLPFGGDQPLQVMVKHLNEPPPRISCKTELEARASDIAMRCLEKDPRNRFQKVEQLIAALEAAIGQTGAGANLSRSYSTPSLTGQQRAQTSGMMLGGGIGIIVVIIASMIGIFCLQVNKSTAPPVVATASMTPAPAAEPQPATVADSIDSPEVSSQTTATEKPKDDDLDTVRQDAKREAQAKVAREKAEHDRIFQQEYEKEKQKAEAAERRRLATIASAAPAVPVVSVKPSENLVYNGDFEWGPPGGGWVHCDRGDTRINGWMVTQGEVDYFNTDRAVSGSHTIDLNAQAPGTISQVVTKTKPGKKYELKFCIGDHPMGSGPKAFWASAGSARQAWNIPFTGQPPYWRTVTMPFTAKETQTTISFGSMTKGGSGLMLDDVSVAPAKK